MKTTAVLLYEKVPNFISVPVINYTDTKQLKRETVYLTAKL